MIRAAILDFDGVILDSTRKGPERIIRIARESGYAVPPGIRKTLKSNWGLPVIELIEKSFNLNRVAATELNHCWAIKDATDFCPLIKGLRKALQKLRSMRLRVCLLTNRGRKSLFEAMDHHDLVGLFYFVQSNDDWSFVKPDPHSFCSLLDKLCREGISVGECVYLGDTPIDFRAASDRGLVSLSALTGLYNISDFLEIGQKPENIISSVAALPDWIENYNKK